MHANNVLYCLFTYVEESSGEEVWEECEGQDFEDSQSDSESATTAPPLPKFTSGNDRFQHASLVWLVRFLIQLQARNYSLLVDKSILKSHG